MRPIILVSIAAAAKLDHKMQKLDHKVDVVVVPV